MNWIFIALMSGMLVTSGHKDEKACLGEKAVFEREHKGIYGKCIDMAPLYVTGTTNCLSVTGRC